jgi:hypothetical protein
MNAADRRLAALAALFAPDRARALLARLDDSGGSALLAAAEALAHAPRRDRLAALGAAIPAPARDDAWRDLLSRERGRVAVVLAAVAEQAGATQAPTVLLRLCIERLVPAG